MEGGGGVEGWGVEDTPRCYTSQKSPMFIRLSNILANFSQFVPDLSLIILISRDHGYQN